MKKHALIILTLPVLFLAACTSTYPSPTDTKNQSSTYSSDGAMRSEDAMMDESHMKGFVMVHGKMMTIWDNNEAAAGDEQRDQDNNGGMMVSGYETAMMTSDVHLKNGMTVMMDGTVKTAEGQTIQLHEGEAMMMDGTVKKASDLNLKEMMDEKEGIKKEGMIKEDNTQGMMKAGEYKDATATLLSASVLTDGTTKVLFFHASWCPICKAANQTLTSWYTDDNGFLTTYKIDYDKEKMLKQKYGVTYQHTFVKVDGQGKLIKSITAPSDDELKDLLKA